MKVIKARKMCHRQLGEWSPWVLIKDIQPELWKDIVVSDGERSAMARDNIIPIAEIKYWLSIHHLPLLRTMKNGQLGCECG